jgi:hypothetical protein
MSIRDRRPAARQWTAAHVRRDALDEGPRSKRLAWWLVIVPALALFSFSLAASAQTGKADLASAVRDLPATKPLVVVRTNQGDSLLGWLKSAYADREVCAVTPSQLQRISSEYQVGWTTISTDSGQTQIATVAGPGANDAELRSLLGVSALDCRLVRRASIFYLPFDAHGS